MTARTESEHRPRPADRKRHAIIVAIGLAAVGRLPRDPRFQRDMIVVAIVLAAVIDLMRNEGNASFERLAAWDARQRAQAAHAAATANRGKPSGHPGAAG